MSALLDRIDCAVEQFGAKNKAVLEQEQSDDCKHTRDGKQDSFGNTKTEKERVNDLAFPFEFHEFLEGLIIVLFGHL